MTDLLQWLARLPDMGGEPPPPGLSKFAASFMPDMGTEPPPPGPPK